MTTVKQFGIWTVAIGGLLLAVLLLFTGRGALAVGDLLTVGPLVWPWIKQQRMGGGFTPGARAGRRRHATTRAQRHDAGGGATRCSG